MTGSCVQENLTTDPLEYGRAQVVCSAYLGPTSASQVHVLKIRAAFERAGILHRFAYVLPVMSLMREVQTIGNGYWFPTPLRRVAAGGFELIVGPHPTGELQRHFPSIERAGYARVAAAGLFHALPSQEFQDWLGIDEGNTHAWTLAAEKRAFNELGPTIQAEGSQFFSGSARRGRATLSWTSNYRLATKTRLGLVLVRAPVGQERWRYLWGLLDGQRIAAESSIHGDIARIQFGISAAFGSPFVVNVIPRDDGALFQLPCSLPRPERRLLLALGTRDMSFSAKTYCVRRLHLVPVIEQALSELGCELRLANG
jgi:hypothetical protein